MKLDLHGSLLGLANDLIEKHKIPEENGFNLHTYLQDLDNRVETWLHDQKLGFRLESTEIARYLWCCLSFESGNAPYETEFRGMEIHD